MENADFPGQVIDEKLSEPGETGENVEKLEVPISITDENIEKTDIPISITDEKIELTQDDKLKNRRE